MALDLDALLVRSECAGKCGRDATEIPSHLPACIPCLDALPLHLRSALLQPGPDWVHHLARAVIYWESKRDGD